MGAVVRRRSSLLISQRPLGPGLETEAARERDLVYWRVRRGAAAALQALRSTKPHEPEAGPPTSPAPEKDAV